ncbi:hypothetical protein SPBRAN_182 [uncultured Candidatus Thioglobus sp.]|nr:hypothetical protein SPBRAN_182 [uncultured Candidatus Thioglobus sp.]
MKITNKDVLIKKLATMLKDDWNGKKGYLSDNEMFKYCVFYTGDFWKDLKASKKKSA